MFNKTPTPDEETEKQTDNLEAALEESEEQRDEIQVVENAEANQEEASDE